MIDLAELLGSDHGMAPAEVARFCEELSGIERELNDPLARWRQISKRLLQPGQPFEWHRALHARCFAEWDMHSGPAPVWVPSPEEIAASNLGRVLSAGGYRAYHRASVSDPTGYWSRMLQRLRIEPATQPESILAVDDGVENARWLTGMRVNAAASCFAGRDANRTAVIVQREGGPIRKRSLASLHSESTYVARALRALGFSPGDAIAIDMPMTYESVILYLGIVLFGGVVVSIADSFAPAEIATRLRIANAKAIVTQDLIARGGKRIPLYERVTAALAELDNPVRAIVLAADGALAVKLRDGDIAWDGLLAAAEGDKGGDVVHVADVDESSNILFSSGTTGEPKAIPWTHATPIKAAADGWAHHDIRSGDVVAWPTNLGWMMGPWLIYASLLNDATIALFDGAPHGSEFCRFVQNAGVTMLGVVPSLVKAWRSSGAVDGCDWSQLRCFSSTGEASNVDDMFWLMSRAGYKPVIEYCGGTEIGGGYITGTVVQPQAPATFSTPALGCDFVIIDERGGECDNGELALLPPLLGSSSRLLNRDHQAAYYSGMPTGPRGATLRRHGDQMERLGGGYFRAHGRVDDTMNLGGIKTSSASIERVCNGLPGVRETAAIAVSPAGGGPSQLVLFVVAAEGTVLDARSVTASAASAIRGQLNPLFKLHGVRLTDALPRTASGKVMRRVLRARYAGER